MIKTIPKGLYAITAEQFSNGKNNIEVVKELLDSGIKIIQYREKNKTNLEKLRQCEQIRKLTLDYNCFFVVNDDPALAIIVGSDGIHIGQDDLPIEKVRSIVGSNMTIGVSTHNYIQANNAITRGANYIGVGPLFKTFTKENIGEIVGLDYLKYCIMNISIPKVAIGGIKIATLAEVAILNPENICMVTEIVGSKNIQSTIVKANKIIHDYYST